MQYKKHLILFHEKYQKHFLKVSQLHLVLLSIVYIPVPVYSLINASSVSNSKVAKYNFKTCDMLSTRYVHFLDFTAHAQIIN